MSAEAFLRDLEAKPAALRALAERLTSGDPWAGLEPRGRVLLLGMGSSRYAAGVCARRLRALGFDAVADYASARPRRDGDPGTLAIGVSATGGTPETVEALAAYAGGATAALTNREDAPLAALADLVVPLRAGEETGGVACRSFQHTLALLLALEAHIAGSPDVTGVLRRTAEATEDLLERRDTWLPPAADLLAEGPVTFVIAPAERLASAQQGALMVREGPRRTADACESGDWLHVDVYLTRPLDYRAVLFAGSRFDPKIMGWMRERDARVLAVGGEVDGAARTLRYRHDDDPEVALLTEVLVAELVAARWWLAQDGGRG